MLTLSYETDEPKIKSNNSMISQSGKEHKSWCFSIDLFNTSILAGTRFGEFNTTKKYSCTSGSLSSVKRNRNETKQIQTKQIKTNLIFHLFWFVLFPFDWFRFVSFRSVSFRFCFIWHFTGTLYFFLINYWNHFIHIKVHRCMLCSCQLHSPNQLTACKQCIMQYKWMMYCIQGKFRPLFIFALLALWPEGEFKTGLIEIYLEDYIRKL